MKHITPTVIILSLIVFFSLLDIKEFNLHKETKTNQSHNIEFMQKSASLLSSVPNTPHDREKTTVETKTATNVVSNSETGVKHGNVFNAADPAVNNKILTEKNSAQTFEIESISGTTTESKLAPVAIPVLTPEEAIKVNKEAIRFQRNLEISRSFQSAIRRISNSPHFIYYIISLLPMLLIFDFFFSTKRKIGKFYEFFPQKRRICVFFSVSLLMFGLFVFIPWSVYFGNSHQFPFIFQDFVNLNLCLLSLSIIGLSIILLLIPSVISDYLVAATAGLGLGVWIQAMFMNQHLGTMNGVEPIWKEHLCFGTINIIIWIIIALAPIILRTE